MQCFSMCGKMWVWAHSNHSFDMCLSSTGLYPVSSYPEFQDSLWRVVVVWWLPNGRSSWIPSRVPSGLTSWALEGCNCWLYHPLLTDMLGNILFLSSSSWSKIQLVFGIYFMTNFCPLVLRVSFQIKQKFLLICHSRCQFLEQALLLIKGSLDPLSY